MLKETDETAGKQTTFSQKVTMNPSVECQKTGQTGQFLHFSSSPFTSLSGRNISTGKKKNVVKCATFSLKAAECSARENNSNGCRPFWSSKSFGGNKKRGQFQTLSLLALKLETIWAPSTGAIHSGELFKVDKAVGRRKEVHKRHFQFLVLSLWWTTGNRIWNELEIFFN